MENTFTFGIAILSTIGLKKNILFIINPISGGKKKDQVPELIKKHIDNEKFNTSIVFSDGVSHANLITREAATSYQIIVAVGGDGTVNEVASAIKGTNVVLGIVPFGSGNGLSRFLGIPLNLKNALKTISNGHVELIDTATLNGMPFFNMAGLGFDAHISEVFSGDKNRGRINYIKSSIREFNNYNQQAYTITIDEVTHHVEAFMLSFANSSQYGNNAHISPRASIQDGLIDVCIIKKFPFWRLLEMGLRMVFKASESTKYVEILRGKRVLVQRNKPGSAHLYGEHRIVNESIIIEIEPSSLRVITGKKL